MLSIRKCDRDWIVIANVRTLVYTLGALVYTLREPSPMTRYRPATTLVRLSLASRDWQRHPRLFSHQICLAYTEYVGGRVFSDARQTLRSVPHRALTPRPFLAITQNTQVQVLPLRIEETRFDGLLDIHSDTTDHCSSACGRPTPACTEYGVCIMYPADRTQAAAVSLHCQCQCLYSVPPTPGPR